MHLDPYVAGISPICWNPPQYKDNWCFNKRAQGVVPACGVISRMHITISAFLHVNAGKHWHPYWGGNSIALGAFMDYFFKWRNQFAHITTWIISNSCADSRHLWCSVRYEYAAFLIHCLYCPLTVICIHVDSFLSNTLVIQSTSRVVFNVILDVLF